MPLQGLLTFAKYFLNWAIPGLLIFIFVQLVQYKLLMMGYEPGSSGIGSDRAVNCATTTAVASEQKLTVHWLIRPLFATFARTSRDLLNKIFVKCRTMATEKRNFQWNFGRVIKTRPIPAPGSAAIIY